MRQSSQVLDDVSMSVTVNDCLYPDIGCDVFSSLDRRLVSTNELLVDKVPPFLNSSYTVYKFPNIWVVHPKFGLQSSMGCFNIVVCTILSIHCPLVHRPRLRRKQCTTSSPVTILTSYVEVLKPVEDWREVLCNFICQCLQSNI